MQSRVGVAEDQPLVLEGLRLILETECEVVGTAITGQQAIALAISEKPDIMLLDIAMPELNGLDAGRQIKRVSPDTRLIFVTAKAILGCLREAFELGASGYVLKQGSSAELLTAVREVSAGRYFLASILAERYLKKSLPLEENPLSLFVSLTSRQSEVLQLVAEGKSAKEIATSLFIAVKTVEFHKKHIMDALHLRTSAELVRYAVEQEMALNKASGLPARAPLTRRAGSPSG